MRKLLVYSRRSVQTGTAFYHNSSNLSASVSVLHVYSGLRVAKRTSSWSSRRKYGKGTFYRELPYSLVVSMPHYSISSHKRRDEKPSDLR